MALNLARKLLSVVITVPRWRLIRFHPQIVASLRFALFLVCVTAITDSHVVGQTEESKLLQPDQMTADVHQLLDVLADAHPDPYSFASAEEVEQAKVKLLAAIQQPCSPAAFYTHLARFISLFQDGHFSVVAPTQSLRHHLDNGGKMFPLGVEYTNDGLLVKETYPGGEPLEPGDRLISINGEDTESLFAQLVLEQSGEPRYRAFRVCHAFRQLCWIHGIREPFEIKWTRSDDEGVRTSQLDGVDWDSFVAKRQQMQAVKYKFTVLDGDVGLIDFRSMRDPGEFSTFLKETFQRVHDEELKGVVVDLRYNGGGNSRLGDMLLSYVTGKPYRMASRKEWKVSESYKDYLTAHGVQNPRYMNKPNGETLVYNAEPRKPPANALRFEGPVCFLIGKGTYSSAVMLANAVEDFELAVLIGEETGGRPNEFGESFRFELANSKLEINMSSARWVRSNGDASNKHGVLPDISADDMEGKFQQAADPVLEYARVWVTTRAKK